MTSDSGNTSLSPLPDLDLLLLESLLLQQQRQLEDVLTQVRALQNRGKPVEQQPVILNTRKFGRGLTYKGQFQPCFTAIEIYTQLMRRLWSDHPEHRDAMALALAQRGRTRRFVGRTLAELFPGLPEEFAIRHSVELVDGWVLDTNLNDRTKQLLSCIAITACGLEVGIDVKVQWRHGWIDAGPARH